MEQNITLSSNQTNHAKKRRPKSYGVLVYLGEFHLSFGWRCPDANCQGFFGHGTISSLLELKAALKDPQKI
jgi:hypothetical protein